MTGSGHPETPRDDSGTSGRRAWIWRVGGLAMSVIALLVVVNSVDVVEAFDIMAQADLRLLGAILVVMVGQFLVRGWRWRILLPPRPDGHQVPISRTIAPMLAGYLGNAVLPARLGEPIRAFLVARREQLDTLAAFGATVLERMVDTVTLALIGLIAALALSAEWWIIVVGAAVGLGGLVMLGLLVAVGLTRMADLFGTVLERLGLHERTVRIQRWARSFATGVDRGRDVGRLLKALALSGVAWVLDALVFWLAAMALGIDLDYPAAIIIGAVSVLSTAIPAAPGYVGTFELAATATGAAVGVPRAEALAMAIVVHVVTLLPLAVAGAVAVVATGTNLGRLAEEAEEAEHVA